MHATAKEARVACMLQPRRQEYHARHSQGSTSSMHACYSQGGRSIMHATAKEA